MKSLEALRAYTPETKTRIALGVAGGVTLVIGVIWVTTIPARFQEITQSMNTLETVDEASVSMSAEELKAVFADMNDADTQSAREDSVNDYNTESGTTREELEMPSAMQDRPWGIATGTGSGVVSLASQNASTVPATPTHTEVDVLDVPESPTSTEPLPRIILIGTTTKNAE